MKTKTRTLIGIVALGLIGVTNINATTIDNKRMANAEVVVETEESLAIESWMTDENLWNSELKANNAENEALEIESWMTDESYCTSNSELNSTEAEAALQIESWMTNESLWK